MRATAEAPFSAEEDVALAAGVLPRGAELVLIRRELLEHAKLYSGPEAVALCNRLLEDAIAAENA